MHFTVGLGIEFKTFPLPSIAVEIITAGMYRAGTWVTVDVRPRTAVSAACPLGWLLDKHAMKKHCCNENTSERLLGSEPHLRAPCRSARRSNRNRHQLAHESGNLRLVMIYLLLANRPPVCSRSMSTYENTPTLGKHHRQPSRKPVSAPKSLSQGQAKNNDNVTLLQHQVKPPAFSCPSKPSQAASLY